MLSIPGYKIYDTLFQGTRSILYRGERQSDHKPILVKAKQHGCPLSLFESSIRNDYEITKDLQIQGVLKPQALERHADGLVLILEDTGASPLRTLLSSRRMGLEAFLKLAISLADILGELHRNKIIHKDINPNHIFVDRHSAQVKLAGFGAALLLSHEETRIVIHGVLEGAFAYISPEQTGMMNRVLDYRTDLYSLGVTFYEILTDQLPFVAQDSVEMVHSHMAREPVPPSQINPAVPRLLSNAVLKLMAKSADERYQSAFGLKEDLKQCLKQLQTKGSVDLFELGSHDYSDYLSIAQKLYGRQTEFEVLQRGLDEACKGRMSLMMVSGYAGSGKTSLVKEMHSAVARTNGHFISGKFDQLKRNIPYSGMLEALRQLVLDLMTDGNARRDQWRQEILRALGSNAKIIVDVIPELEQMIGPQPPVMVLGPVETQNRFNLVFRNFVQVFCSENQPLVIFLDDLQWVDTATLRLMEVISTYDENHHIMLIGAYRINEVSRRHPLTTFLENVRQTSASLGEIHLGPLNFCDISRLISDTLRESEECVAPLAASVHQKTYGNPFFVKQFLSSLPALGLLTFSKRERRWQWSSDEIEGLNVTDNVIGLLIKRMKRLAPPTWNVLRLAACIGNRFDLDMLAMIAEKDVHSTFYNLMPASDEGLVIPTVGCRVDGTEPEVNDRSRSFRFVHDRVQQAACALIEEEEMKPLRLKIGHLMLRNTREDDLEERVFDILNHLNFAGDVILEEAEREEMARLNLLAGERAREAAAFDQAFAYFQSGIRFLGEDRWIDQYALTLRLHTSAAEAACLSGRFETMEEIFQTVIQNAVTVLDKTGSYKTIIRGRMLQSKTAESLAAALEALGVLGVTFPPDLSQYDPSHAMQEAWSILSEKTMDDLLNLPEMTDPLQLARLQILVESAPPAYFSRIELLTPIVLKHVDLTLRYGHTEFSPYVFCGFGLILCGIGGYIEEGYKSAQIGLGLMEHRGTKGVKCKMYHLYNGLVRHFKQHIRKSTERTEEVFQAGLETGDFEYAGWYAYMHCMHLFMAGEKLPALAKEMAVYNAAIRQIHQQTALDMHEPAHQAVLNLMSDCHRPTMLIGDVYDERSRLQPIRKANDRNSMLNFYFNKIMLCYLFENYEEAFEHAEQGIQYLDGSTALLVVPLFHFYDSLVQLAVCNSHSGQDRERVLKRVRDNLKKIGLWATHAPMNHLHKYYLVEAERLRVTREHDDKILENYNLAIQLAKENGFLHEEALANKMAAAFWLEKGMPELASSYMGKALANYATWGAVRICRYLEEKYSELLSVIPTNTTGSVQVPAITGATTLDLSTLLKASQAVSREIELHRLIRTFMTILLENRGAQKGFLILTNQDELEIEATCSIDEGVILFRPPVPVQSGAFLPSPIVRLVAATHETVVIDDARQEKRFQTDPYIKGTQPRSVLCLPILQKAALTGIIYLENNLISGAFTPERLEVVRVLASQIAISIDNARLYDNLRKAEEKYRGIFDNAVEGIYQTTPGGCFITANPAMAQMFGFETPEELLESVIDIRHQLYVSPERRDEFIDLMQRKERVFRFEAEFYRRNGSRFWAALYARPVCDEEGHVVFMEGLVTDITHQKKMMEALQESEEFLRKENIRLRSNVKDRFKFGGIVGKSPAMQDVYELILKAAASDANVIIYGESGAGKELVAREIHNLSDRKGGRLVTVNSAAIPENLLESEFFGYKRGAFTGANRDKRGYLDLADGGTLFLDELGELAPSMQAKLLRVIDGGGYVPIGETTIKHSSARIIAATNRDLQDHVRKGIIREDFFFRIHVVPIYLPPLRERREDIPLLIEHFMNSNPRERVLQPIPASVVHLMQDYNWPGNVRELRNAVERYLTLGTLTFPGLRSALKTEETLFQELPEQAARLKDAAAHFEKCYITRLLEKNQWHRGKVAEILGVDRRTLFRKMKTYEIEMSH